MVSGYLKGVRANSPGVTQVRLLAKGRLLHFYTKICGFDLIGPSPVVHGADQWWDLGGTMADLTAEPMIQVCARVLLLVLLRVLRWQALAGTARRRPPSR